MILRCLLLAFCMWGCLQAQSAPEALDAVPPGAMAYVFARSPLLLQAKLKGLQQRMGGEGEDPLSQAQAHFGLRRLPTDRRGVALVFLDPLSQQDAHPLLFLAVKDPKPLLEELKAVPAEEGLLTFKAKDGVRMAALREGWVILGDRGQFGALKRAVQERGGLRAAVGDLAPWLEEQDFAGLLTAEGMWGLMQDLRKQAGAARNGTPQGAQDPLAKAEQFLAQAQREIRFIGLRGDLDEHGNLKAVLRLQLQAQGAWAQMSQGLDEASERGLHGLRGDAFFMAMGGSLPPVWLSGAAELSIPAGGILPELDDIGALARREALERLTRHLRGLHMVMTLPGRMEEVLDLDDAEAYLRDQEAFWLAEGKRGAKTKRPIPVPQWTKVGDHDALAIVMPLPEEAEEQLKRMTPEQAEAARQGAMQPLSTLVKLDPHTVSLRLGPLEGEGNSAAEGAVLKDAEALREPSGLLPDRAHFFAFMNLYAMQAQQREALRRTQEGLPEEQRRSLSRLPELRAFPALGLALRFDATYWELHLALPWETQMGLTRQEEALKKAQEAVQAAQAEAAKQAPDTTDTEED